MFKFYLNRKTTLFTYHLLFQDEGFWKGFKVNNHQITLVSYKLPYLSFTPPPTVPFFRN
ncbi:hypothetical protein CPX_001463 [Candidatus Phytoplasma pruni]|uniref:Uncharacterized protein n=1 Tax=Candidatus Phytoplasma pruni TaxID=479893 RepID=A0A0M1N096_9MOLU|nr:hypothetical protein CPX_001463 [Candidatus Phytoplasma pruni]